MTTNINVIDAGGNTVNVNTLPPLGAATTSASLPVTMASDQNVPVTQSGTWTVQPGDTQNTTPWLVSIAEGGNVAQVTASSALKVDASATTQPVNLTEVNGVAPSVGNGPTNSGVVRVTLSSDSTGQVGVHGLTAAGVSISQDPVTIGALAKTSNPTAVADGQVVNDLRDKLGKQIAVSAIRELKGTVHLSLNLTTTETQLIPANATAFNDIYRLIVANTSATACNVTIRDSLSGTTRYVFAVAGGATCGFSADAGSATPQALINTAWTAQCSASVGTIEITADYVQNT